MRRIGWLSIPRVCTLCGRYTQAPLDCCPDCERTLPVIETQCDRCGLPMEVATQLCNRCLLAMPAYDQTLPGFHYSGTMRSLITRFKDRADLTTGRFLSDIYARRLSALKVARPDLLVPMPMHITRFWRRGFDHSRVLTRDLSDYFDGLPWSAALRVRKRTKKQSQLVHELRWSNVHQAFSLRRLPKGVRHVALVDDVMESGATAHEAARVLKRAGVERVDVWVIARA